MHSREPLTEFGRTRKSWPPSSVSNSGAGAEFPNTATALASRRAD